MIDPMLSMAASVQASPGVYALLLGSGVSRSAGIPTGWEVVEDLVKKIAVLHSENCDSNPHGWFKSKFGREPHYSDILEDLAPSPSERRQLLSSYFEPTEEEHARGLKLPTASHKSIAQLVVRGLIRVIVTTNFDRLLEAALRNVGVESIVISTPDAVVGAPPIMHSRCTIVKIHGDYLDSRIRNTRGELEKLDPQFEQLLDRVFDEFGLIICGWSAEWDAGLRTILERCPTHRFTTYWTTRSEPSPQARNLISLRRARSLSEY